MREGRDYINFYCVSMKKSCCLLALLAGSESSCLSAPGFPKTPIFGLAVAVAPVVFVFMSGFVLQLESSVVFLCCIQPSPLCSLFPAFPGLAGDLLFPFLRFVLAG
jgi:hypothetical protein